MSTSILGDGYVEVIPDADLLKIRDGQPKGMRGLAVAVPVVVGLKKGAASDSRSSSGSADSAGSARRRR